MILTPDSLSSEWVHREWNAVYMRETEEKKKIIIPILLKECVIPLLLRDKKYVDFMNVDYALSLVNLIRNIDKCGFMDNDSENLENGDEAKINDLNNVLKVVNDKSKPLSQSIVIALAFGKKYGYENLIEFCKNELRGWKKVPEVIPKYRTIDVYFSIVPINNQFNGWGGSASNMFSFMDASSDFRKRQKTLYQPISVLEEVVNPDKKKDI